MGNLISTIWVARMLGGNCHGPELVRLDLKQTASELRSQPRGCNSWTAAGLQDSLYWKVTVVFAIASRELMILVYSPRPSSNLSRTGTCAQSTRPDRLMPSTHFFNRLSTNCESLKLQFLTRVGSNAGAPDLIHRIEGRHLLHRAALRALQASTTEKNELGAELRRALEEDCRRELQWRFSLP